MLPGQMPLWQLSLNVLQGKLYILGDKLKQAVAELGQAQLKLELDFTLTFCRFGLIELAW